MNVDKMTEEQFQKWQHIEAWMLATIPLTGLGIVYYKFWLWAIGIGALLNTIRLWYLLAQELSMGSDTKRKTQ